MAIDLYEDETDDVVDSYNASRADEPDPAADEDAETEGALGSTAKKKHVYMVEDAIGLDNITGFFTDDELSKISTKVIEEYEIDDSAFSTRKKKIEDLYKLALQAMEQKNYPFENSSNIKYPILTKAALGFASLAFPAIVKDDRVVKGKVIGSDKGSEQIKGPDGNVLVNPETGAPVVKGEGEKAKKAERVSTFMSNQVLNDMDGWEDDTDKMLHIIPIIGMAFKKVYPDSIIRKNASRLVLPQYLVINIDAATVEDALRATETVELYPHEIEENIRLGIFRDFEYSTSTETKKDTYSDSKVEEAGSSANDTDKPHLFLEQHRRLDLDKDGYAEPYTVWVHKETREVARILARFDVDDIFLNNAKIARIKGQSSYVGFPFIPDPEGSVYGIGFGHLLYPINEAVNTGINQLLDAGHRRNMGGGFIAKGFRFKGGTARFRPGEYKRVDNGGMSIRDSVVNLDLPEPSLVLFSLIEFLIKAAGDISTMTKVMAGEIPANTPATTTLASIEQGMQTFKAIFKRVHRGLKREFRRLFYLNQKYLTQEEYMRVLDDPDAHVERDFKGGVFDIMPVSDPELTSSTQALIRAQALDGYKDDPLIDGVEVRKRIFAAMNIEDPEKLIKIPPKTPDELVEAQKLALQAQVDQIGAQMKAMQDESARKDMELILKIEKNQADIRKTMADAVKALADAEATENTQTIEQKRLELDRLAQLKEGLDATAAALTARNGSMESPPDNS